MTEPVEGEVRVTDKRLNFDEDDVVVEGAEPEQGQSSGETVEVTDYLEDLQRLKADFENYRKRVARDQAALIERASQSMVERLLPVLDNFELALLAADRTKDYASMVRGVEMVYGELLELLHKEGLERIQALGHPFDPAVHEAVMRADGEGEANVVVDEMRPGYKIHGRVVRPAMVKVGHEAPATVEGDPQ